jgi:hypothetical protein
MRAKSGVVVIFKPHPETRTFAVGDILKAGPELRQVAETDDAYIFQVKP